MFYYSETFVGDSKPTIFISQNGDSSSPHPQTLKICLDYDNLPQILINLDSAENEKRFLKLKEFCDNEVHVYEVEDGGEYHFQQINMKPNESSHSTENATTNDANIQKAEERNSGSGSTSRNGHKKKKSIHEGEDHDQQGQIKSNRSSPTKEARIPILIQSNNVPVTGGTHSCDFYRKKLLEEVGCTDFPNGWNTPYYYGPIAIQKTAGQKVVNKLAAQQKVLEEQAAAHRKRTEFVFHEELGFCEVPNEKVPLKKKNTRLEPLQIHILPKCY